MTTHICSLCGKPLLPGEAVYTIQQIHYDCKVVRDGPYKDPVKEFKTQIARFDQTMNELKAAVRAVDLKRRGR